MATAVMRREMSRCCQSDTVRLPTRVAEDYSGTQPSAPIPGPVPQRGQKNRNEKTNEADDDQKLDERKSLGTNGSTH